MDKFDKADVVGRVRVIMALYTLYPDYRITSTGTKEKDDLIWHTPKKDILFECKHIHKPSYFYKETLISSHKIDRLEALKLPYLVAFSWDDSIVRIYDLHKLLREKVAYRKTILMTKTTFGTDTIKLPEEKIFFPTDSFIKEINLNTEYAL